MACHVFGQSIPTLYLFYTMVDLFNLPLVYGLYGLEFISSIPRSSISTSNSVDIHVDSGDSSPFHNLRSLLITPTKPDPLSDGMVAGVPNCVMVPLRTSTAFLEVASLNICAAITHLDASSRYKIRFNPRNISSFMACQLVYHMEFANFYS